MIECPKTPSNNSGKTVIISIRIIFQKMVCCK